VFLKDVLVKQKCDVDAQLASRVAPSPYALNGKKWRCKHCVEGKCCYTGSKSFMPENIIQSDSGGKLSMLQELVVSVIVRKKKSLYERCLILNSYRDRADLISRPNSIRFLFVFPEKEQTVQKKGGYTRRIARSLFGCCCRHKTN
jgi:hypothetical protein